MYIYSIYIQLLTLLNSRLLLSPLRHVLPPFIYSCFSLFLLFLLLPPVLSSLYLITLFFLVLHVWAFDDILPFLPRCFNIHRGILSYFQREIWRISFVSYHIVSPPPGRGGGAAQISGPKELSFSPLWSNKLVHYTYHSLTQHLFYLFFPPRTSCQRLKI